MSLNAHLFLQCAVLAVCDFSVAAGQTRIFILTITDNQKNNQIICVLFMLFAHHFPDLTDIYNAQPRVKPALRSSIFQHWPSEQCAVLCQINSRWTPSEVSLCAPTCACACVCALSTLSSPMFGAEACFLAAVRLCICWCLRGNLSVDEETRQMFHCVLCFGPSP